MSSRRSSGMQFLVLVVALAACGGDVAFERPKEEKVELATPAAAPAPPMAERDLSGRGGVAGYSVATSAAADTASAAPESAASSTSQAPASEPALPTSMIIRTGQASIEVDSLDRAVALVRSVAQRAGGFVANSAMTGGRDQVRSATLELKFPAAQFDAVVGGLSPIGHVETVNVQAQDVGEEYVDVAARETNARRLEARLIALLEQRTGKLSDVLAVEHELARVREDIERMEGRMRFLRSRAAVSTLAITVHEPLPIVPHPDGGSPLGEAFRQAWRNFVMFLAWLIASSGVLVPLAGLTAAALWALRAWLRRMRPRRPSPPGQSEAPSAG